MPWGKDIPPSLRPEGPRETSRGLSGRHDFYPPLPRASAFVLSPGLGSHGPLGRFLGALTSNPMARAKVHLETERVQVSAPQDHLKTSQAQLEASEA